MCLFWKKNGILELLAHLGSGEFYPHLFCDEITNFHGNKTFGAILKRNFYTSTVDILQGLRNNHPVNFLGIAQAIVQAFLEYDPQLFVNRIVELIELVDAERKRLVKTVDMARLREIAVRGEVRLSFDDLASVGTLLAERLHPSKILDQLVVVSTETITRFISFYVELLMDPIVLNLALLNQDFLNMNLNHVTDIVTTVSAFESLLTFTMFSGTTHSYVRRLVWASGPRTAGTSLKLMHSIKTLNHPVFEGSMWNLDKLRILNRSNEIVEDMYKKLSSRAKVDFEPLRLIFLMGNDDISPIEKANYLWLSYFHELPESDYKERGLSRWKLDSLKEVDIRFISHPISLKEAVSKVFNISCLAFECWRKPYLLAFKYWRDTQTNEDPWNWILKSASEILKIEVIRYHSGTDRFLASGHTFERITNSQQIHMSNAKSVHLVNASVNSVKKKKASVPVKKKTGTGNAYSLEENIDLIKGYNSFCLSSSPWADIEICEELCFSVSSSRSNGSLKDRFRFMCRMGLIVPDPMNNGKYILPGHEAECRKKVVKTQPRRLRLTNNAPPTFIPTIREGPRQVVNVTTSLVGNLIMSQNVTPTVINTGATIVSTSNSEETTGNNALPRIPEHTQQTNVIPLINTVEDANSNQIINTNGIASNQANSDQLISTGGIPNDDDNNIVFSALINPEIEIQGTNEEQPLDEVEQNESVINESETIIDVDNNNLQHIIEMLGNQGVDSISQTEISDYERAFNIVSSVFTGNDLSTMMDRLGNIPTEYTENFRYNEFSISLSRSIKRNPTWKE